jgi:hypothetical protein
LLRCVEFWDEGRGCFVARRSVDGRQRIGAGLRRRVHRVVDDRSRTGAPHAAGSRRTAGRRLSSSLAPPPTRCTTRAARSSRPAERARRCRSVSSGPIPARFQRQTVEYDGRQAPGTIVIDTPAKYLYLVQPGGKALRYGIGVGRPGFEWAGMKTVSMKREWPDWRPAGADAAAATGPAALHGRRSRQPARRSRALSWLIALPHPRHRTSRTPSARRCPRAASA